MGRGNFSPNLENENYIMFYVDNGAFREEEDYENEETGTFISKEDLEQQNYEDFKSNLTYKWIADHKEFSKPYKEEWKNDMKVLLEANGMYVFTADNDWSVALWIMLEDFEDDNWETAEEKEKEFLAKLKALEEDFKNCLAEFAGKDNIRVRAGAWCSGPAF